MPLYTCACGRSTCREHRLPAGAGTAGGCKMCAPGAFAAHQKELERGTGTSWAEIRPRIWGLIGLVLCAVAAYTVLSNDAPRYWLVLLALMSLAAVFRVFPPK